MVERIRTTVLSIVIASFIAMLTTSVAYAQEKRESVIGQLVSYPEHTSGLWEAADGQGGAVGLHVVLATAIQGAPKSLVDVPQRLHSFLIGAYQRKGSVVQLGEQSYFNESADSGASWDGMHLILKRSPQASGEQMIDVDLTYDRREDAWTGSFQRGRFSANVKLRRPALASAQQLSPFVGTWSIKKLGMNSCLHIFQQADGKLTGWSDDLLLTGLSKYASGLKPPEQTLERYGDLVKVTQVKENVVSIEFKAYSGVCCAHTYLGTLTDGRTISGYWQPGPNQIFCELSWRKHMSNNSCRLR
jgi:hypothetical protein